MVCWQEGIDQMKYKKSLFTKQPIMEKQTLAPPAAVQDDTKETIPAGIIRSGQNISHMERAGLTLWTRSHMMRVSSRGNVITQTLETVNNGPLTFD